MERQNPRNRRCVLSCTDISKYCEFILLCLRETIIGRQLASFPVTIGLLPTKKATVLLLPSPPMRRFPGFSRAAAAKVKLHFGKARCYSLRRKTMPTYSNQFQLSACLLNDIRRILPLNTFFGYDVTDFVNGLQLWTLRELYTSAKEALTSFSANNLAERNNGVSGPWSIIEDGICRYFT